MRFGLDKNHPLNGPYKGVMATLITSDLNRVVKTYEEELDYKPVNKGKLPKVLTDLWQAKELEAAPFVLMVPESGVPVFLRFIEYKKAAKTHRSLGWFALEICVQNAKSLYEKLSKGERFSPFAEPKALPFSNAIIPMQCVGPIGEILYLNEVRESLPDIALPIASSEVDHLFISVLSSRDMEASLSFYEDALGARVNERHEIPYKTINRVYDLPLETQHKLATLGAPGQVTLEIDQAPEQARARPDVYEGVWMVSFTTETIDASIGPHKSLLDMPYNGAQVQSLTGLDGERFELIQMKD